MTLQSSGSMTIADINTELGRASGAQLSTDDADLLLMADLTSGDPITIPDDLYGKYYKTVYEITAGNSGFLSGYFKGSFGSVSPASPTIYINGHSCVLQRNLTNFFDGTSNIFAVELTDANLKLTKNDLGIVTWKDSGGSTIFTDQGSTASFSADSTQASWTWTVSGSETLIDTNVYDCTVQNT